MIVLHAFIKVDPNHRIPFLEQAQQIMKHSKAEEGNNSYHLYEDTIEPNSFVMLEEWDDLAAIEYHNHTEHYKAFKDATANSGVPKKIILNSWGFIFLICCKILRNQLTNLINFIQNQDTSGTSS